MAAPWLHLRGQRVRRVDKSQGERFGMTSGKDIKHVVRQFVYSTHGSIRTDARLQGSLMMWMYDAYTFSCIWMKDQFVRFSIASVL